MRRAIAIAILLVACRAAIWLLFEQADFDSDQAIVGLMARHLAEGRAFPVYLYGQRYMLAVESWVAAPFLWALGASVFALKLPIVLVNATIAVLLVRGLIRDVGLRAVEAVIASMFFLLAPPVAASRLVAAAGGNIEPLLYVLLLWVLRERGAWFGAVAGLGLMHREFSAYGISALLILEGLGGTWRSRARWRFYGVAALSAAAILLATASLRHLGSPRGPGTAAPGDATTPVDQAAFWTRAFCWQASALAGNVRWLFERNLATLFGWRVEPLAPYVRSTLTTGASWAWMPLAGTCLLALAATIRGSSGPETSPGNRAPAPPGRWFPIYLVLVGLQSAAVYAGFGCLVRDPMLLRYTLLALFVPVGATAWLFVRAPSRIWRLSAFVCVALWAVPSAVGHLRVIDETRATSPAQPVPRTRDLSRGTGRPLRARRIGPRTTSTT